MYAGNNVFNPKEDTAPQSKILALLLQKSLVPAEKDDPLGLELANKLAELEEVRTYLKIGQKMYHDLRYCGVNVK